MLILKRKTFTQLSLSIALGIGCVASAHAEIYKLVDANGRVTYSNAPMKGATRLNLEPLTTVPGTRSKVSAPTPAGFPKVDGDTQKKRDDTRRKILEDELVAEENLLTEAKKGSAKEEIELHEKNVGALKKEISNLK
jgi:hypothetical protein